MKLLKSLYFRNFLTVIIIMVLSFAILAAGFSSVSYGYVINEKTRQLEDYARYAVGMVSSFYGIYDLDNVNVRALITALGAASGYRIILTDEDGLIVSTSDRAGRELGSTVPYSCVTGIINSGEYRALTSLGGLFEREHFVVGFSLSPEGYDRTFDGYIFVAGAAGEMSALWRSVASIFGAMSLVVIAVSFVVVYFTSKKQARPLTEMAGAAAKFERGDFSVRVNEYGRQDEIGELAHAFNKMAESLERGEKARRDLIANVSHELKTPMTTITGFADGILDGTIPPEKERDYLAVISSETKRLSRLVRGMLDMNRLQSEDAEPVKQQSFDMGEVMRIALVSLEQKITSRGLDVDAVLPEEPVMVLGDMDSITQVVYNLIDNAAKFASPGSAIGLELWKQDGKAWVSVKNDGETIPKEELPLIFDRFHKTDRSRSMDKDGVGLGLYIVKTILDSHKEDIYVESRDGVTTFTFTMKLA